MTFFKTIFCILLTLVVAGPSAAQSTQKTDQNQSIDPKVKEDIASTLGDFRKEISEEKKRQALGATIRLLMDKRIAANVRGYEKNAEFRNRFEAVYSKVFGQQRPEIKMLTDEDVRFLTNASAQAYKGNKEQFKPFYESAIKSDPRLQGVSEVEIIKAMVEFSALLYQIDRVLWGDADRMTYLWPMCQPRPEDGQMMNMRPNP